LAIRPRHGAAGDDGGVVDRGGECRGNEAGIAAPTDPNYSASRLSVTVTGLPTEGTVLLADGVTAITNGEILTIAQLTGLEFKPTAEAFGQSSTFAYTVADPNGNKALGTATLALGPDPMPPATTAASLTDAGNAAADRDRHRVADRPKLRRLTTSP
jgi:hypothetical protein